MSTQASSLQPQLRRHHASDKPLSIPSIAFLPQSPTPPPKSGRSDLVMDLCSRFQLDEKSQDLLDMFTSYDDQSKELFLAALLLSVKTKMEGLELVVEKPTATRSRKSWKVPQDVDLAKALRKMLISGELRKFKPKSSENHIIENAILSIGSIDTEGCEVDPGNQSFTMKDVRMILSSIRSDLKCCVKESISDTELDLAKRLANEANVKSTKLFHLASVLRKIFISGDAGRRYWDLVDAERDGENNFEEPRRKNRKRQRSESILILDTSRPQPEIERCLKKKQKKSQ